MIDSRIKKLAHIIVNYSLEIKKGSSVLIDNFDNANQLTKALIDEIFKVGAHPFVWNNIININKKIIDNINEEYIEKWIEFDKAQLEKCDYYIAIRNSDNINEFASLKGKKLNLYNKYINEIHLKLRVKNTKWSVLRYPNESFAQLAGMNTEDFEDFYFKVCTLDYSYLSKCMIPLKDLMDSTDKVRIIAKDTNLSFSLKGHTGSVVDGRANIPDGEVCTGPIKNSVNGTIRYNVKSTYLGHTFDDIYFEIKEGKIIKATANDTKKLNEILNLDEGCRYFGEFAIGTNPYIDKPINDILFDEKMTGSIHFTPGNGWGNKSQIHWDIVQSHLPEYGGGEIWFDDVLIRKDGKFTLEQLKPLNQENWK